MFCLIDGNNFYVACEQLFDSRLRNRPVVVLSNNDGCVVSRSQEAKEIGIKMGEPFFKCKQQLYAYKGVAVSSNYALYENISQRITVLLKTITPDIEVYSIDESFLKLNDSISCFKQWGIKMRQRILNEIGISVGIGFGKTKTLAKLANMLAKQHQYVCNIHDYNEDYILQTIPADKIWGIGKAFAARLRRYSIHNAYHLKYAPLHLLNAVCHIHGKRKKLELMGISAYELESPQPAQSITRSRSFKHPLSNKEAIKSLVVKHVDNATIKLRKQGLKTKQLTVFLCKNRFKYQHYYTYKVYLFPEFTSVTSSIARYTSHAIDMLCQEDGVYTKAGIILQQCVLTKELPQSLFDKKREKKIKIDKLMDIYDGINNKWGKSSIRLASEIS
ncbi:Y-family DNA polymerase [bacterium]|nr:Y-family DNA polymerase [bacterium]